MDSPSPHTSARPWLVLVASSPEHAENRLLAENVRCGGIYFSELFVPYTMLGLEGGAQETAEDGVSLRSALRRYLFAKVSEEQLQRLVDLVGECNRIFSDKIFFLKLEKEAKTDDKLYARIKDSEKAAIEDACHKSQGMSGNLPMPGEGFAVGQKLSLAGTQFEHIARECEILEVKPRSASGSVEVRVMVEMFGLALDNFTITFHDTDSYGNRAVRLSSWQKKLLDAFCHRVNSKKFTAATRVSDEAALQNIFGNKNLVYPPGAMKRHFLALMLICAHLLKDEEGVKRFTAEVEKELDAIAAVRESKAATDTRAYLHIAAFIATGDVRYRTMAKTYIATHKPSSPYLRRFVATMSMYSATKVVGPPGRTK